MSAINSFVGLLLLTLHGNILAEVVARKIRPKFSKGITEWKVDVGELVEIKKNENVLREGKSKVSARTQGLSEMLAQLPATTASLIDR